MVPHRVNGRDHGTTEEFSVLRPNSTSKTTTALSHALAFGVTLIIGLIVVSVAPPVSGFERHYARPRSAAAYDARAAQWL